MNYQVLIAFNELRRDYPKGSIQTFGEWTDEVQKQLIPGLISSGKIEEITVSDQVDEIPATILNVENAQQIITEAQEYLKTHAE